MTNSTQIYFSDDYVVSSANLETVSKAGKVANNIKSGNSDSVIVAPRPVTREELLKVHSERYVDEVLFGTSAFECGPRSPEVLRSILASTSGCRDAALSALKNGRSGSLSSGLHHAGRNYGNGFCTINGLALAAVTALEQGVGTVGILDLDAHFGGGTFDILGDNPHVRIADVSVSNFDRYSSESERHQVVCCSNPRTYLQRVDEALAHLGDVDFLIYNAGVDAHEDAGGLRGITKSVIRKRERAVARFCAERNIPVMFVLAGGYAIACTLEDVVALHLEVVDAFSNNITSRERNIEICTTA